MKKTILKTLCGMAVLSVLVLGAAPVMAEHPSKGGNCPYSGKHDCGKAGCDKEGGESGCPVTNKFFKKAKFFLGNAEEIGLSDKQVQDIKALKAEVKKIGIRQMADMQLTMLDFESLLGQDPVDQAAIGALIDKGAASMTQGAKAVVKAYADLKAVLSAEQMAKAKALWKAKEKGGAHH